MSQGGGFAVDNNGPDAKVREQSVYALCRALVAAGDAGALRRLVVELRPFFERVSKAKTAKIVRKIIEFLGHIPDCVPMQAELTREVIAWCVAEKRTMLRQRLEARLAAYLLQMEAYTEALALISELAKEVKKLDDKLLLVEIHLVESRIHHALANTPKSRAALTASRANANAIYCPPGLQAEIDRQAGVLCCEDSDFKTGYGHSNGLELGSSRSN